MREVNRNIKTENFGQGPDIIIPEKDYKNYKTESIQNNKYYKDLAIAMKEGTKEL